MFKRILCVAISILMVVTLLGGCKSEKQQETNADTSTTDSATTETMQESESGKVTEESTENQDESTLLPETNTSEIKEDVTETSKPETSKPENSKPNNQPSDTTGTSQNNNNSNDSNNSTDELPVEKLNITSNNTLFENYPTLTQEYIYPSQKDINFTKNSSNIYENKYVKVDATTAKDGYLLITYKDVWAEKLWIVLDETATHSGVFQKTHHFRYDKGSFKVNEPIAVPLPKTDAIYFLVVDSEINGLNSDKLIVDLGQITANGAVSYQDMVPTEEAIKLVESPAGVYSNKYVTIDTNTASKGYVEIEYIEPNGYDICVTVYSSLKNESGNDSRWHYNTANKGKCKIKVALTYGSSEYTITVTSTMKNASTGVGRVSKKAQLTVKLTNVSNTAAFLLSTGEVIFDSNMMFIKKAAELSTGCKNDFEKVAKIYDWLTAYLQYSKTEATAVGHYKCDLDKIYNRGTGVCYDYAVILAAMLRSQGIPCKVVFGKYEGYSDSEGHAWNEVYISSSGNIKTDKLSITGNKWCTLDPTLSSVNTGDSSIEFMNNPANYVWKAYY